MTEDMMSLRTFVEKTPDADLLREMIGFAAERLMELEVGAVRTRASNLRRAGREAWKRGDIMSPLFPLISVRASPRAARTTKMGVNLTPIFVVT